MTHIEPGPPPTMTVVTQLDLRTYPRVLRATRAALVGVGLLGLLFSFAYSPLHNVAELPAGVRYIAHFTTLWFWSAAWLASGVYSIVSAMRPDPKVTGSAGVQTLFAIWGFGYLITWLSSAGHSRSYITAGAYIVLAALLLVGSYVFNTALTLSRPPRGR